MCIQNMLNNYRSRKSRKVHVRKKKAEQKKITNKLKKLKEAKQKFTEQHKQKIVELESQFFN